MKEKLKAEGPRDVSDVNTEDETSLHVSSLHILCAMPDGTGVHNPSMLKPTKSVKGNILGTFNYKTHANSSTEYQNYSEMR